jgi:2-oxoglutarate dehydrogenase E2 component (dihydrolipoamide succinyltransferase)
LISSEYYFNFIKIEFFKISRNEIINFAYLRNVNNIGSMSLYKLLMPKMGEGVIEATIINWLKKEGDKIREDETIVEVATDKVDTEIQSPVSGIIRKINYEKDSVVPVGEVLVFIEIEGSESEETDNFAVQLKNTDLSGRTEKKIEYILSENQAFVSAPKLTPLVRKMLKDLNIHKDEILSIVGTGANGKLTKRDILNYQEEKKNEPAPVKQPLAELSRYQISMEGDEIVEMDRMRKLISQHMVDSKRIAPHVTSVVEADLTELVQWRDRIKDIFFKKFNQKITFLPVFIEAVVKAIKDFPNVNASVDGDRIILRKSINIGIATALSNGNLIVPVIKNAGQYNLEGLTMVLNDLIGKARENKLKPDDIAGGTFTITNLGTMGNIIGTPIINQPQVAILATGAIVKKPSVIETEHGDVIGIRNKMYLSLSYDHRVVDGFLGGTFLKRISDYLEKFNTNQIF